tara:strand:+ start:36 stop:884 length:849 start_codon:yes stop_codon:yes gene_type:complete
MHGADKPQVQVNWNDDWTEKDYDKFLEEMNLYGRRTKARPYEAIYKENLKKNRRDWYVRKLNKEMQKTLDELCNGQRFSAKEVDKNKVERRWNKQVQFNRKISDWVRNCANYMMQGDFGMFCDAFAGTIVFFDGERESMYVKANHSTHDEEDSIYAGVRDALHSGDKYTQKIWFKGKNNMLKDHQPDKEVKWVFNIDAPLGPGINDAEVGHYQLDMRDGGFCTKGSHRKVDCVNALILRNEFVLSRRAVRGLGKGSYELGAKILYQLMGQWEREANRYAQRR